MRKTLTSLLLMVTLGVFSVGCGPEAPVKKPQTPAAAPATTTPKEEGSQTKTAAPKEESSQTKTGSTGSGSGTK